MYVKSSSASAVGKRKTKLLFILSVDVALLVRAEYDVALISIYIVQG